MNKELSTERLIFFTRLSGSETRVSSGGRLETIKQDTHLVQDSSPNSGYFIQAERVECPSFSCEISMIDTASGMISELKKT